MVLNDALLEEFQRDGAVCLKQIFTPDQLALLERGFDYNFKYPGPYSCNYTPADHEGGFFDDYCNWNRITEYRDFIFQSSIGKISSQLLKVPRVKLFHEHVFHKLKLTKETSPWHQDLPYYCIDGVELLSFWIPLTHIDQSESLEFIAGSHLWSGLYTPRKFLNGMNYQGKYEEMGYKVVPEIDQSRDQYKIKSWSLSPGDGIAFHMKTLHGTSARKWALRNEQKVVSIRVMGEKTLYKKRPGEVSPPFPYLNLKDGDEMPTETFPYLTFI